MPSKKERPIKCNYCKTEKAEFVVWNCQGEEKVAVQCGNCEMATPWVKVRREAIKLWQVIQIALKTGGFSVDNIWDE